MGKNPAFLFYPSDWTRDLDDLDLEIEGAWIRILCRLWWSSERGKTTKPLQEFARILRKTEKKTLKILQILIEKEVASGNLLDNQNITIISRRMIKDVKISKIRQEVGKLGGNPGLLKIKENRKNLVNQNSNQNNQSSVSVSVSDTIKEKIYKKEKLFLPPTEKEVVEYFNEKGYRKDIARKAFEYYNTAGWKDSKGNPVRSWKQKMVGVWFKDENKTEDSKKVYIDIPKEPECSGPCSKKVKNNGDYCKDCQKVLDEAGCKTYDEYVKKGHEKKFDIVAKIAGIGNGKAVPTKPA